MLVDALLYAQNFWPKFVVDIGSTAASFEIGVGQAMSGIYTNSEELWQQMKNASVHSGDRVWRFPLWRYYTHLMTSASHVDVQNSGVGNDSESCKAAAFLREFVPCGQWMHIECHNVMVTDGCDFPYLREGMAGRPVRTLIEFIAQMVCRGGETCR